MFLTLCSVYHRIESLET